MGIDIYRVYDYPTPDLGLRILVDRLWPRGIRKTDAPIDKWMKDIAPSSELRKWYSHEPQKWDEFKKRYYEELAAHQPLIDELIAYAQSGDLVLVYSSRERERNNAQALKAYLENKIQSEVP